MPIRRPTKPANLRVANRTTLLSRGTFERSTESDVYSLACLAYFSGGNFLNAVDLLFAAMKETRRGRRFLDVTPVLARLRPERGLGQRLLLRGLPSSLIGAPPGCGAVKLLLEALILVTPGTAEGGDCLAFDPAAVQEILDHDPHAASLAEDWLQLAIENNLIEERGQRYRINSSNGLISLIRML